MASLKKRDNGPEMAVRRLLHAAGLRYRVAWPVPGQRRRSIDIAFTRARLAVFIDGCYWHGCPAHGTTPKTNREYWTSKVAANRRRDEDTIRRLTEAGWQVARYWEHEPPGLVAADVRRLVEERRAAGVERRPPHGRV